MDGLLRHYRDFFEGLMAIALGVLPQRYWSRFPSYPIHRRAALSGIMTALAGVAIGARGFFIYINRVAAATSGMIIDVAEKQNTGKLPVDPAYNFAPIAVNALSPIAFLIATPTGWFATYLLVTGGARFVTGLLSDPTGDPLLTLVDRVVRGNVADTRAGNERRAREAREGAEVPDRLYTGEWAGLADVDFVVVASRRKQEWEPGTFVITEDKWFKLGVPYDLETPHGLRTVYPLTEHNELDVLRKGVPYVLPALSTSPRRQR